MNKIFEFMDVEDLYKNCIVASIAHAVMVGKYPLLSSEQSWDGMNYNIQEMNNIRGTISFDEDIFFGAFQKNTDFKNYSKKNSNELLIGAEEKFIELAKNEALLYLIDDVNGENIPVFSVAFWGEGDDIYSNLSEKEIIHLSEEMIMPYIYNINDAYKCWKKYYEMSEEQVNLVREISERRMTGEGTVFLEETIKDKLKEWFDDISECLISFEELNIFLK